MGPSVYVGPIQSENDGHRYLLLSKFQAAPARGDYYFLQKFSPSETWIENMQFYVKHCF